MRRRQRNGPIAGMARSYTDGKGRISRQRSSAPRMMENFPVGAALAAITAPPPVQTPIRGQGRSYMSGDTAVGAISVKYIPDVRTKRAWVGAGFKPALRRERS